MNEPTMNNMVQRLDRLEKENHRLKRIGALVVVGIAAVVLMGQTMPTRTFESVVAKEFILRDKSGEDRGVFGINIHGSPRLSLFYKRGDVDVTLGLEGDTWPFLKFSVGRMVLWQTPNP